MDRREALGLCPDNATVSVPSNDALLFHRRHGTLITVLNNGRTAERGNAREEFNNGVVMTNRLLKSNELFEVVKTRTLLLSFPLLSPLSQFCH